MAEVDALSRTKRAIKSMRNGAAAVMRRDVKGRLTSWVEQASLWAFLVIIPGCYVLPCVPWQGPFLMIVFSKSRPAWPFGPGSTINYPLIFAEAKKSGLKKFQVSPSMLKDKKEATQVFQTEI